MNAVAQVRAWRRRVFYGWWILAGGMVLQTLNGLLLNYGFGAYFVYLQAEFGWTRTVLAGAFSMSRVESGMLGPVEGWLIDRFGPRAVMHVGLLLFGIGFILISQVHTALTFYMAFFVIAIGSSLGTFMAISTTLAHWFLRRRSLVMGLTVAGAATGGFLVPLVALSLSFLGWRNTALLSGIVIILVGTPVAQLMRHSPEKYGYLPDGHRPEPREPQTPVPSRLAEADRPGAAESSDGFTAREALRTPAFWLLSSGHALSLLTVAAVGVHAIAHLVDKMGLSVAAASAVISVLMAMAIVGQVVGGYIGDHVNKRLVMAACMLSHAAGLLFLAFASTIPIALAFAVLQGLAWGFRAPLLHALRAEYFGRARFATIFGFSSVVIMLGMTSGPLIVSLIADRVGTYEPAFVVVAVLAAIGAPLFLLLRRPALPVRA